MHEPGAPAKHLNPIRCPYCQFHIYGDVEPVPAVNDDATWQRLAEAHDPNCVWILTRAHRDFSIVDAMWSPGAIVHLRKRALITCALCGAQEERYATARYCSACNKRRSWQAQNAKRRSKKSSEHS